MAYGSSQARGWIRAVAASLHHSHRNAGSELHLQPTPQLMAIPDLWPRIKPAPSRILVRFISIAPQQKLPRPALEAISLFSPEGTWKEGVSGPKSALPPVSAESATSCHCPLQSLSKFTWATSGSLACFLCARASPSSCHLPEPQKVPALTAPLCWLSSACTTFHPSPYLEWAPYMPLAYVGGGGCWTSMASVLLWPREKLTVLGDGWQRASWPLCL